MLTNYSITDNLIINTCTWNMVVFCYAIICKWLFILRTEEHICKTEQDSFVNSVFLKYKDCINNLLP